MWSFVHQATLSNLELLDQILFAAVCCILYGTVVLPDKSVDTSFWSR